ncbi:MAG: MFS transporter [Bacillaceae bacterium]|nr:MFS transporter [Bacillaceae bacterium]
MSTQKRVVGIALITAVAVLGDAMLFIVLPLYWREFGLTAIWQIGVLLSINRFVRLPINPLVGLFYKHFQLRTGVFIAVTLAVVTTFSYGTIQSFWILVVMRALWGVAWSLLRLGGFLTVIDVTDDHNRGKYVGLYNGLWGLGGLIGMLAGGFLVDQTSIFFVTTIFAVLGALSIPAIMLLVPDSKRTNEKEISSLIKKRWLAPYVSMVFVTGATMGFIVFGLFASTLSPLIEATYIEQWTVAQFTIGAASLAGILQAIRWGWDPFLAPWIGKQLHSKQRMLKVLLIPLFLGGTMFIVLGNIQSIFILIVGLLIFQLLSTIFVTTTDTIATNAAAHLDKVKVMTVHTVVVDIGAALGPFVTFSLLGIIGLSSVYMAAGFLLILLGIMWWFTKNHVA